MNKQSTEALSELSTVRDFIRWSVSRFYEADLFYGHGTVEPWDEAVGLVLYALYLPQDIDQRVLDSKLTKSEKQRVLAVISQRVDKRVPAPYLTHEAWFAGMPFYVDERVLIPRSPIAELIENQFSPWVDESQVQSILDIGTGSGCIAIATALYFPEAEITAVDVSEDALKVAKNNIKRYALEEQVNLVHGDLFQSFTDQKFDIIISNPPYVSTDEMQTLPREYTHEPRIALQSSDEGLAITIKILQQAHNYLTDNGIIIIEVGNSQEALMKRLPDVPFTWLEFERGGEGVFLLTAKEVKQHYKDFLRA